MQQIRPVYLFFVSFLLIFFIQCRNSSKHSPSTSVYLNLSDTVAYIGKEACKVCHEKEYATFMQTGMGKSFDKATHRKSDADFSHNPIVFDSLRNFYYRPYWQGDTMKIEEYRLYESDTIYKRVEDIAYIIGSGHHTNSHMININGFVYQAPLTFYTQEARWDLPPGFKKGLQARFDRPIKFECMTCHNGLPALAYGSENKYLSVPSGIACERCHGPGALHARQMKLGHGVDTASVIDWSIVNPKDLSIAQQMSLCQRCHLQGPTVLKQGKNFMDFKASMNLGDIMDVFLPEYEHPSASFIMASHADRLRQSACYAGGKLSCINCHNPHANGYAAQEEQFQKACLSCHQREACPDEHAKSDQTACYHCHMPPSPSIDIPHVHITDHRIQKPPDTRFEKKSVNRFKRLKCMTNDHPGKLLMAQGYLRFYEGFNSDAVFLDSVKYFLDKVSSQSNQLFETTVHYHYLKQEWKLISDMIQQNQVKTIDDPYTLYRIGEAFYRLNHYDDAIIFTRKAYSLKPLIPEFANRLGSLYVLTGNYKNALDVFESFLKNMPDYVPVLSNLGILEINTGNFNRGIARLKKALALNPDYNLAYTNLVQAYMSRFDSQNALKTVRIWLLNQPDNIEAIRLEKSIGK